jgi:hypothetical protein
MPVRAPHGESFCAVSRRGRPGNALRLAVHLVDSRTLRNSEQSIGVIVSATTSDSRTATVTVIANWKK